MPESCRIRDKFAATYYGRMNNHITYSLHSFTADGQLYEYARIQRKVGNQHLGQSLMLERLAPSIQEMIRLQAKEANKSL